MRIKISLSGLIMQNDNSVSRKLPSIDKTQYLFCEFNSLRQFYFFREEYPKIMRAVFWIDYKYYRLVEHLEESVNRRV